MRTLLKLLILMVSLSCASQPPVPTQRERIGVQQEHPAKSTEGGKEDIAKAFDSIYEKLATFRSEYQTYVDRRQEEEKTRNEASIANATWALAIVTFGLFIATYRLYKITSTLAREAKESSEQQLRAYVSVETAKIRGVEVGQTPEAIIVIKNFGQTPAYGLNTVGGLGMATAFETLVMPDAPDLRRSDGSLAPTATTFQPHRATRTVNGSLVDIVLTQAHIDALRNGQLTLWAYAEMTYRDIFKIPRVTRYRFQVGGRVGFQGNSLAVSEEGNEET